MKIFGKSLLLKISIFIVFIINSLFFAECFSQEQNVDSTQAYNVFYSALSSENSSEKRLELLEEALIEAEESNLFKLQSEIHTYIAVHYISKLDSANIFKHLNKTREIYQSLNVVGKSYVLLLLDYAFAYQQLKKYDISIDFAEKGVGLTDDIETNAKLNNSISVAYISMGDYEEALKYLYKASEKPIENIDPKIQSQITHNLGIVFFRLKDYSKALEYFNKALEQKLQCNDVRGQMRAYINIGNVNLVQNNKNRAYEFYQKAYQMAKEANDMLAIPTILLNLGSISGSEGNHKRAIEYYQEALNVSKTENHSILYNNLGSEYLLLNNMDAALFNYQKAYKNATQNSELENIKSAASSLSNYYQRIKNYKKALEYQHIYSKTKDSLLNTELIQRMENIKHKHERELSLNEIIILKKNNELKELKLARNRKISLSLAFSSILLIVLLILLINRYRTNKKNSITLIKQQEKLHIKEREIYRVEQEKLLAEISTKNYQLSNHIIQSSEKKEFIETIISKLQAIKTGLSFNKSSEINALITELRQNSNDNIWQEFDVMFNEIQQGFYEKLHEICPNLSAAERRLCAFLRMDMTTKEIAHITHKSAAGIDTARSRLRKKLNISDSSIILSDYLRSIS